VLHAKLSLRTSTQHGPPGSRRLYLVDDDGWDEAAITFATAPELGRSLGAVPNASRDSTRSIDVTAAVNEHGDDVLTLALGPRLTFRGPSRVVSREGGQAPRLVLIPHDD
jgi:hypothetical protein